VCSEKYAKKVIGRTDIEDALKRLDKLTHEEAWMGIAQNLKATNAVGENVMIVVDKVEAIDSGVVSVKRLSSNLVIADCRVLPILSGNQLRESIHKWLSPPDPSTNHNIACDTHHKKTASWFFQGSIFQEWKSTGSLLWLHGKRLPHPLSNLTFSNSILYCSWIGQKRSLVRGSLKFLDRDD
jgi:hypothetical protein